MSSESNDKPTFQDVQERLEQLGGEIDQLDEPTRGLVYETLDAVDVLHRTALGHVADALGEDELRRLRREAHPAVAWLLAAYDLDPEGSPPVGDEAAPDDAGQEATGRDRTGQGRSQAQPASDAPLPGVEPPPGATVLTVQDA